LVLHPANIGYCAAFNSWFKLANGDYVIDFSGDDVLLPGRVWRGVQLFQSKPDMGIQFSDAAYIDADGRLLSLHSARFPHHRVPQGRVFAAVLTRYFICSPTMMMRRSLLSDLGGYDETLAYEDFDLWVRAASRSAFYYVPEALVQKRVLPGSLATRQWAGDAWHTASTYRVVKNAKALAKGWREGAAVRYRAGYEAWQCIRGGRLRWALRYAWLAAGCG
jgi:GT2 family glycosyltransferase